MQIIIGIIATFISLHSYTQWNDDVVSFFKRRIVTKYYGGGKDVIRLKKYCIQTKQLEVDLDQIDLLNSDIFYPIQSDEFKNKILNSQQDESKNSENYESHLQQISSIGSCKKNNDSVTLSVSKPIHYLKSIYIFYLLEINGYEHFSVFKHVKDENKLLHDIVTETD